MIKPDWSKFKAKFSENPQSNFEWFCYLLFCKEFSKPHGIFRYKNQSAIETDPIKKNDEVIGWQAKFYNSSLSKQKNELLKTIEDTKANYSDITKLFFYSNQEWVQNKSKKPKGLLEIEEKAEALNIELVWKTTSFFESEFVSITNEYIASHFFSLDKSILELLKDQLKHTENILKGIKTCITFNNRSFQIDRDNSLIELKNGAQQVLIVSGPGGVGKTALINELYDQLKEITSFYIFKANEFELRNINVFFKNHIFTDFIDAHKDEEHKIIVIDSAEKLLDIRNLDPFNEILSILIEEKWKIIFTTRDNYLEELNYQFFEIHRISPLNINIRILDLHELNTISEINSFSLPKDGKLLDLIRNPFYLNEYLNFYNDKDELDYINFRNNLWNKNIKKFQPSRERCFLQIAFTRANEGQFFVNPNCESNILDHELTRDGILGYEDSGYFIAHDIYEEWALDKIIERSFKSSKTNQEFFKEIGESLPIRRSFRSWLSEKLLFEDNRIFYFVEEVIETKDIDSFWKDEVIISVLLSDYSDVFFLHSKNNLLKNNQELLQKLIFLLRLACKEVDDSLFNQIGVRDKNFFSFKYVFTKPKGQGWESLIKFVFENLDAIGIENINLVLPAIHDWNSKFRQGRTTKLSSLIALQHYQWLIKEHNYSYLHARKEKTLQIILYGSSEIKNELKGVIEEIIENKSKNQRDTYSDLSNAILTKLEGISVCTILPNMVLQLADLDWSDTSKENSNISMGVEKYFGIKDNHNDYYPASAYQTPIYWLLNVSLKTTIDFILEFTNKAIEFYARSDIARNSVKEIEIHLKENSTIRQYISDRIWCTYRGTQNSPYVLESMHMALEKFFLEQAKNFDSEILQKWLFYLLINSKSASITSVVASIVLANPDKTFYIAETLFKTKELFFYDTTRLQLDQNVLCPLKVGAKGYIFQNERIESRNLEHRKTSLENLFLKYQLFKSNDISDIEAEQRQKSLWNILDNYYKELSNESNETESNKIWRLSLLRMDRRKMNPILEKKDGNIILNLNPEINQNLKDYSEKCLQNILEQSKYIPLNLWASLRLRNDEEYKTYAQYENNPKLALQEVQEIIVRLVSINNAQSNQSEQLFDPFYLSHYSIPGKVCAVLVKDYFNTLNVEEKSLCREFILEVASSSFRSNYKYQISDGIEASISVLPLLLKEFPDEAIRIKTILLMVLFDPHSIGMYKKFSAYSEEAIHDSLWKISFKDAQSILFGYLFLESKYEELSIHLPTNNYGIHESQNQIIEIFLEKNNIHFQRIIENKISFSELTNIEELELDRLATAFKLIPLGTSNQEHKEIVKIIISVFSENLLTNGESRQIDYDTKHDFLERFAYFVLSTSKVEINEYLEPFLRNFNNSKLIANLFQEFILAAVELEAYDNFWKVWYIFKDKVIEVCKEGDNNWYASEIIKSYLLAEIPWKENTPWLQMLKDENRKFFSEISQTTGHCPSTLYAISRLLDNMGSHYLTHGISWISDILKNNSYKAEIKLKDNTIYYLENIIRKFIYLNREKIKKIRKTKEEVLLILNFLIGNGSVVGYFSRENIL